MEVFPVKRQKCHFDYDNRPIRMSISESWIKNMLIYTIYLWGNGNGKAIICWQDPKQIKAAYFRKKKLYEKANVRYVMPSPLELVSMAHGYSANAYKVVQNRDLAEETLSLLEEEYVRWQIAVKAARGV